jgi:capsular polysaccharide biosynthesis protein
VGFQRDFLEALPIAASDLVYLDEGFWRLSRAVVPRMRTDESGRFSPHFRGFRLTATPADFFTWISESVEHIVDPTINSSSCVYISRSDTTKRIIKNENELIRFLENKGFSVLRTGGLSLSQQVSLVRNAKIIIGPHGAGLTNLAFARHLRALVEIRNEQNADIGYRFMCQYRNARYFTYLSTSVSYENCDVKDYDMHVDMGVFRKFYDDVLANMISASN